MEVGSRPYRSGLTSATDGTSFNHNIRYSEVNRELESFTPAQR